VTLGAAHVGAQTPAEQVRSTEQTTPQLPQFMLSRRRSAHAPAHTLDGALQPGAQTPITQGDPVLQALPQRPQCCALFMRLGQSRPHCVNGALHGAVRTQTPARHASSPTRQALPQAPQFWPSVCVSTQRLLSPVPHAV